MAGPACTPPSCLDYNILPCGIVSEVFLSVLVSKKDTIHGYTVEMVE